MPDRDPVGTSGQPFDLPAPVEIGRGSIRRGDHPDIAAHLVVDVAAECDCAGDREALAARLVAAIEVDLEPRWLGKAVDAVAHGIEIGEGDIGTLRHDQRAGHERLVALRHCTAP
jgi:hypothetical protein